MDKNSNIIKFESLVPMEENINVTNNKFKKIMLIYSFALKEIETRINILRDEFKYLYNYELIYDIKTRIKSLESIISKMTRKGYSITYGNLIKNINDIAGIRVICKFENDIIAIKKLIKKIPEVKIIKEKDYINNPKESGYKSHHIILTVPVNLLENITYVKVEIQIRTIAMDNWANIEHAIKYKPIHNVKIKN